MSMDLDEQYDKIYRYSYYKLHHRETAEDVTQDTFLRFLNTYGCCNKEKSLQMLYTIARNLCVDEFRRRKPELLEESDLENKVEDSHDSLEEQIIRKDSIKSELGKLPEEDRELILLRYVNEVPLVVLGKLYGVSRFVIYRRCTGILAKLKKGLEEWADE